MKVLVLSGDPGLVDDLLRLSAAASVEVVVAADVGEARSLWGRSSLVLVGFDLIVNSFPRRSGVVLVAKSETLSVYRKAIDLGAEDVAVLPSDESRLITMLASACTSPSRAPIAAVCGARGGAGASVFAATLALMAARSGRRPLLVDGDPLSPGIDLLLGLEHTPGTRWPDLATLQGRLSPDALASSLPSSRGVAVLSHHHTTGPPIPPEVLTAVLSAARSAYDLLVVDQPRAAAIPSDHTFLIVPAELRSTLAARALAPALPTTRLHLITRGPAPGRLPSESIAQTLSLPLTGHYAFDRRTPAAAEQAALPTRGPLPRLCAHLLSTFLQEAVS